MRLSDLTPDGGGVAPVVVYVDAPITAHASFLLPDRMWHGRVGDGPAPACPVRSRVALADGTTVPATLDGGYVMAGPLTFEVGYTVLYLVADPSLPELSSGTPTGAVVAAVPPYRLVSDAPFPVDRKYRPPLVRYLIQDTTVSMGLYNDTYRMEYDGYVPTWLQSNTRAWKLHIPNDAWLPSRIVASDGADSWPGVTLDVALAETRGGIRPNGIVLGGYDAGYVLVFDGDGTVNRVRVFGADTTGPVGR